MAKRQQAITVSFAKKNIDLYNFLVENKTKDNFSQNDFIINAMRFYIKYKDSNFNSNSFSKDQVNALISERLLEFKDSLKLSEISIDKEEKYFDEDLPDDIDLGED